MHITGMSNTDLASTIHIANANIDTVASKVAMVMAQRGYRLESGDQRQGVYGCGSAAAHAMLGPLVRRRKLNVTVTPGEGDSVALVLAKGMSGWGGGLLSAGKQKKELAEIIGTLQAVLS